MNISGSWTVVLVGPARKALKRIAAYARERIHEALAEMAEDPFRGNIKCLIEAGINNATTCISQRRAKSGLFKIAHCVNYADIHRGQKDTLRRRVGDWRIFFRLVQERKHVLVSAIQRRTTTTY